MNMSKIELNIDNLKEEKAELADFLASPNAYSDPEFSAKNKRFTEVGLILEKGELRLSLEKQLAEAKLLSSSNDELGELAKIEVTETEEKLTALEEELFLMLAPKDLNDEKNVIIEIRAGAGGDEASLFAGELYRLYLRYAEVHNLKTEILSQNQNDTGGIKEVIFKVSGDMPYSQLKFESGVHRVQRVPATESQGRVHTSTVTVAVLPEAEEADIEIIPADLRIDIYRASGHGGQSVNTTDSAVRITHLPTGLVVTNQDEKSQIKNKEKAMGVLRSRLLQQKIDAENAELTEKRSKIIDTGEHSEKIRPYNFPQHRITDHRIGYSRSNIPAAMNGEIDDIIERLHSYERELAAENANG